ncbi:MAG TPA: hypothetical protein VEU29_07475, partial [Actinomycetota bacterium]|nr:hypothetical protein [Actinomycetota bacterium]
MRTSLRRDFVAGALAVGLVGGALAGSASSAAQPPTPAQAEHAHPAQGQPPPERGSREDREQISDSAQELGIHDPVYGMPADEHGRPAAPTTHRGDPASGEYGSSRQKCVGDGLSGERLRVFYGYPSTETSNYNTDTVNYIRAKLGYANYYLYDSNATYAQDIRWQCNSSGLIQVTSLPLY